MVEEGLECGMFWRSALVKGKTGLEDGDGILDLTGRRGIFLGGCGSVWVLTVWTCLVGDFLMGGGFGLEAGTGEDDTVTDTGSLFVGRSWWDKSSPR